MNMSSVSMTSVAVGMKLSCQFVIICDFQYEIFRHCRWNESMINCFPPADYDDSFPGYYLY